MKSRVAKLEVENCDLSDELDRLHCVSRMRYRQVQHLETVVQKLCEFANIDFSDQDYCDPEYFSRTFFSTLREWDGSQTELEGLHSLFLRFFHSDPFFFLIPLPRFSPLSNPRLSFLSTTAFRALPSEVIQKIVTMVDCEGKRSLKRVCQWWNQVTKEATTCLAVRCPGGMRGLISYPRLKSLYLSTMHITEAHYQAGKYMLNLSKISFYQVASIPFHILSQLPYLTCLEIKNSEILSMEGLDTLTMLEEIKLDSLISSFAFPVSACHPKLRRLSIVECFCIRVQTRFLGCCKNLEYMHIDSSLTTPITDISFVCNTPNLTHFAVAACCGENMSAFSLEPLATLRHLEYLNLKGISDMDYSPIFELETIKRFIPGVVGDDEFIGILRGMKSSKYFESIELSDNDDLTEEGLSELADLCPNMYRLLIMDCMTISQDAVCHLKRLKRLTCLQLSPELWWGPFTNLEDWKTICCNVCLDDL